MCPLLVRCNEVRAPCLCVVTLRVWSCSGCAPAFGSVLKHLCTCFICAHGYKVFLLWRFLLPPLYSHNICTPAYLCICSITDGMCPCSWLCPCFWSAPALAVPLPHTAKTQYRKFEGNIPRKGISQFPHSCVCERFISSHRSGYSATGKYVYRSWEYINRLQTHECGNWERVRAIPFLGIYKWDFRCSAGAVLAMGVLLVLLYSHTGQLLPG